MNKIFLNLIFLLSILLTSILSSASTQDSFSRILGFELSKCINSESCIVVNASDAISGNIVKNMYRLKNIKVKIVQHKKNEKTIQGLNGYVDFDRNYLIVRTSDAQEVTIDLNKLSTQKYNL